MSACRFTSLAALGFALLCNIAGAQMPRVVQITVTIESTQFQDGLGATRRVQIESAIAEVLVSELAKPFPLMDWRSGPGASTPAATLTAAVVEHDPTRGADPNATPVINLVWRAMAGNNAFEMPSIQAVPLYASNVYDRPIDDFNGQFLRRLDEEARKWVNSETNREKLKAEFLKHVLLANSLVTAESKFVVVPLPWAGVKMRKDSTLLVRYVDDAAGSVKQVELTLTGAVQRLTNPLLGSTQTRLEDCEQDGTKVSSADIWRKCVGPLDATPARPVSVYAANYIYEPHPEVEGGFITEESE